MNYRIVKLRISILSASVIFLLNSAILAQSTEWKVFTNEDTGIFENDGISCIVEDKDNNIWFGTDNGCLVKFDGENWTIYDSTNSPIKWQIWTLAVDPVNNLWIGTYGSEGGLIKFDGVEWHEYNLDQYGINGTSIFDIEIDKHGNFWMGTYWDGLTKFDGEKFTIFNSQNSGLGGGLGNLMDEINCVAIDDSGYIWIGSDHGGAAMFDGDSQWTNFHDSDSTVDASIYTLEIDNEGSVWFGGVKYLARYNKSTGWHKYEYPENYLWPTSMSIDSENVKWFSSWKFGFYKFDNNEWTHIYPTSPDLSEEGTWANMMDSRGNIWIGYNNGHIALYNQTGIISDIKNETLGRTPSDFELYQNYPNPFNPATSIKYSIAAEQVVELVIYDVLGKAVATPVNKQQGPGTYMVEWDASRFASGIYYYTLSAGSFFETKKMILLK